MPRRIRLFIPGGIYHVYNRVTRGEHVFELTAASEHWVNSVREEKDLHKLKVLAWCLMTNHYHLVIKIGDLPLWRAMARFQARVAREHNRRHRVTGPLWQSRYKARLVRKNTDLENLLAYVHLNPVTAKIVDDPADYPWSGHRAMIGQETPRLLDLSEALLTFDEDPAASKFFYLQRLRSTAEANWMDRGLGNLPWWTEADDIELTMSTENPPPEATTFDSQPLPPEEHLRPPGEIILEHFEVRNGLPSGRLSGSSRTRRDSWYRRMFSTFAVCRLGFRVCEVASLLDKTPGSVSRWIADGYQLQLSNKAFRNDLADLQGEIDTLPAAGAGEQQNSD